jgi:NADH-quinone oxidoreductase subunit F
MNETPSSTPNGFAEYLQTAAPRGRTMLLPALHEAQAHYGWLSRETLEQIGQSLRVPLADIHGVVEFYSMFYNQPTSPNVVRVCEDPACSLAGAETFIEEIEHTTGLSHGETREDNALTFERVTCLGMCEHAPAGLAGEKPAGNLNPGLASDFLRGELPEPRAMVYGSPLWLLKRVGVVDPLSLDSYLNAGGYQALTKALELTPEELTEVFTQSGILGRGGAMYPYCLKLQYARSAAGAAAEKHIVVNADESEPGTFKDRCLLEEDPFAVLEAATLSAYAVGAENGWIFVRGEYPRAYRRLQNAVAVARARGYLGDRVLGRDGFRFDIEVRLGAGAYICGEETALFEAIEGKRGFPRIKPPFPTTHGLFGGPTAINNVETLFAGLAVLEEGLESWRSAGTKDSPGTKLFCLSGNVEHPGVYELPFGLTIAELIGKAGGVPGDRPIQAVLMGGAAGVFIGPEKLDTRLTYEDLRTAGIPLGSGVIQVFDDQVDLRKVLYQLSRFFAHESCGKCFPCQLGTERQMEILRESAQNGSPFTGSRQAIFDIGKAMTETSLCGLGQTAASAVMSAASRWPELLG